MSTRLAIVKTARRWSTAVALASIALAAGAATAYADCVGGLALCAVECDQRTKPQQPERPQCARTCVSNYQRCERIEIIQSTTGGGAILNKGNTLAPAQ
jgi:hypothetical protein